MRANYKVELASGLFIFLGVAALLWLATAATNYGNEISKDVYFINATFTNVGDLKPRAAVKIGGVTVGTVETIALDPDSYEALVHMKIDQRYNNIPNDSSAAILTSGLLGDRYIGLELGGAPDPLRDGDNLFITNSAIVLENLVGKYLFNSKESE